MLTESCALLSLLLTKYLSYKIMQTSSLTMQSLSQTRDEFCCTCLINTTEIIVYYRKHI
jgi:hypothetical protein